MIFSKCFIEAVQTQENKKTFLKKGKEGIFEKIHGETRGIKWILNAWSRMFGSESGKRSFLRKRAAGRAKRHEIEVQVRFEEIVLDKKQKISYD